MPFQGLDHAVLYVRDVARSLGSYRDVLGFPAEAEIPGRAVSLQAEGSADDRDLGLFAVGAGAGPSEAGRRTVGLHHLAWEVDTLAEPARVRDALVAAGALVGASDHATTEAVSARGRTATGWAWQPGTVRATPGALVTLPTARPLALVTGASSGIGLELAKQFAEHGYDLVIAAEDAELDAAAEQLRGMGAAVSPVRGDLTRYEDREVLVAAVRGSGRPLAAAAINAGVGVGGAFTDTDLDAELGIVALNCGSTVHIAKRVAQDMAAEGEGRILFTSSVASQAPQPFQSVYGASKAFVQHLALSLREELSDRGVSVTALLPGPTDTEFFDRGDLTDTRLGATDQKDDPALVARQGYEGLMKGEASVFAGSLASKAMGRLSALTPGNVAAKLNRKMAEPGSGES